MQQLVLMIQRGGYIIRQLNDKFYFHININTFISWTIILLMYFLYKLLEKYFRDKELDSLELLKLLGIYMIILLCIMASYLDVGELMKRANPGYSFFIIILAVLGIVILMAWSSRNPTEKKKVILITLYTPIVLLMLTNGHILDRRSESLKSILPRSNFSFLNLPGEVTSMQVGGTVSQDQVKRLIEIAKSHSAVKEAAAVSHKDDDNLLKPLLFVVLKPDIKESKALANDIRNYIAAKIKENWISRENYSRDVEFVSKDKLAKMGNGNEQQNLAANIVKQHKAVANCKVLGKPEEAVAYVVLKDGYEPSKQLSEDIISFAYKEIKKRTVVTAYLIPRWVEFIDEKSLPKDDQGNVKWYLLQKRAKNWSELFPNAPSDDPFIREFEQSAPIDVE